MNQAPKSIAIRKKYTLAYLYFISGVCLFFTINSWASLVSPYSFIAIFITAIQFLLAVGSHRLPYSSIEVLFPVYLLLNTSLMFPFIVILRLADSLLVYIWYIMLPVLTHIFYQGRKAFYWNIYILFLIVFSYFSIDILHWLNIEIEDIDIIKNPMEINEFQTNLNNFGILVFSFIFVCYCLYFKENFYQSTYFQDKTNRIPINIEYNGVIDGAYLEKYTELYNNILSYFEKERPYINHDYTIIQLANVLNSNIVYISHAIKMHKKMNYTFFVNTFRINHVKEMIAQNTHNKYTLEYIYLSSGFRNQSTFNKVFKQIEGITPSEFYKKGSGKN
jgi:AraC-like DNA-binding protein